MEVGRTHSYCCECQTLHEAVLTEEDGRVLFESRCPRSPVRSTISPDAGIFRAIRSKSAGGTPESPARFSWLNILEITEECNFECPVCFARAGAGKTSRWSLAEVVGAARALKDRGLKAVSLSGGEPTLHPDLFEMIRSIRALGLDVTLLSNGVRVGEEESFARRLKQSGITYCYFQLDTRRPEVHRVLRGNDTIAVKTCALTHARNADLPFGIISTVIRDNLDEVGSLVRFAAGFLPHLAIVTFLAAARAGRFLLGDEHLVTREDIIRALVDSGEIEGLTSDHFYPFPRIAPLGLNIHPDCAALLFVAVNDGKLEPLERYVNVARLYRLLARARGRVRRWWGYLWASICFTLSIKPRRAIALYRMLLGTWLRRGKRSLMVIAVEQFMTETYQDQERLDRCTTCNVLKDGELVPACIFQHPDQRRSSQTRRNLRT